MPSHSRLYRAHRRHANYYSQIARSQSASYRALHQEYPQIRLALGWLTIQLDTETAPSLLAILRAIAPYLYAISSNAELIELCQVGFRAAQCMRENPGWLWLLQAQSHFASGAWSQGLTEANIAIQTTRGIDLRTYARATFEVGKMQLNQGDYAAGLKTLKLARPLLVEVGDRESVAEVISETAAYYLNRGEHQKALLMFQEADRIRGRTAIDTLTDHSLLMLGVAHRKLGHFDEALKYLISLAARGEAEAIESKVATAEHHLAWTYLEMGEIAKARLLADKARTIYVKIGDPRGQSDADEQLGVICLREGSLPAARHWLNEAVSVRQGLGNKQGLASSLRWLAILQFHKGDYAASMRYLARSLWLYARIRAWSWRRLFQIVKALGWKGSSSGPRT